MMWHTWKPLLDFSLHLGCWWSKRFPTLRDRVSADDLYLSITPNIPRTKPTHTLEDRSYVEDVMVYISQYFKSNASEWVINTMQMSIQFSLCLPATHNCWVSRNSWRLTAWPRLLKSKSKPWSPILSLSQSEITRNLIMVYDDNRF